MRLSLTFACACACAPAMFAGCGAAHMLSSRVHLYDDARLTVISPTVRDDAKLEATQLGVQYGADIVSGATQALTVDAVSSATKFAETRHQLSVSGVYAASAESELSAGYGLSLEPDHGVHAPQLGFAQQLFDERVRASVRYQLLVESMSRTDDAGFSADALGHRVDLGWTQIATRTLVVTALGTFMGYDCAAAIGCFANPYRYVGITQPEGTVLALRERHPHTRVTSAGALRLSWAFAAASALHGGYRLSGDTWGLTAHTADAALASELFASALLLRLETRATLQSRASFYRADYRGGVSALPAYRTADAELSKLWNVRLQLHAEWDVHPVRLVAQVGRMWNRYPDFPALPSRHGWLAGVGLDGAL